MMLLATSKAVMPHLMPQLPSTMTWATVALCALLTLLIFEEVRRFARRARARDSSQGLKSLPGPWGLPLLGNILQLGAAPHKTFQDMARKYGDVFQIRIGSRPVIVLNGYDTIRQALVKQSTDFAGRPDLSSSRATNDIFGRTLTFSSYSEGWKLHRKITESTLRHFTCGSQLSSVGSRICKEAKDLVDVLTAQTDENNNDVQDGVHCKRHPFNVLKLSISNAMYSYIFGRRHSLAEKKLLDFVDMSNSFSDAIGTGNPADFMPWMSFFSRKIQENFMRLLLVFKGWFGKDISDQVSKYEQGSEANILDCLITVYRRMDPEKMKRLELTEEMIINAVYDMFGAGFDTMSALLQWTMALMIIHPDVQRELQAELDSVVGREHAPSVSDRGRLPLTESCLLEILRFSSVLPMTIPHSTTRDTELNGYFIPKDTVVFINLYSMSYDATIWERPDEFRPRRFLNEDGTGLDPSKTIAVTAFGVGKRRCIGSALARLEFFLYFTTLMHQCTFEAADGETAKIECGSGLLLKPLPFGMTVRKRDRDGTTT